MIKKDESKRIVKGTPSSDPETKRVRYEYFDEKKKTKGQPKKPLTSLQRRMQSGDA